MTQDVKAEGAKVSAPSPTLEGPSTESVIDSHHHLFDPQIHQYDWMDGLPELRRHYGPADLAQAIVGTPVVGTIAVQATGTLDETLWLIEQASQTTTALGVVGWVDLESPGVAETIGQLVSTSPLLRGVRHQVQDEADPFWLQRHEVMRGLRAVGRAGLTFDLLFRRDQSQAVREVVEALPDQRFIVDHAAKPHISAGEWEPWVASLRSLASLENVACKISGFATEASWATWRSEGVDRYVEATVGAFGADRCMVGSDWPVCLLAASYEESISIATSSLAPGENAMVRRGTAEAWYGVQLPPPQISY